MLNKKVIWNQCYNKFQVNMKKNCQRKANNYKS